MSRKRLPNRRASTTFELEVGGLHYVATVSMFASGGIAELFIGNHKCGSGADINARDGAVAVSLALQHGCDVETIRRALSRDANGNATGPLGAALDAIAAQERGR
jgi:hypothetical protein